MFAVVWAAEIILSQSPNLLLKKNPNTQNNQNTHTPLNKP